MVLMLATGTRRRYDDYSLPEGSYHIDIIDAWNMTVDRFADAASGEVRVELPSKKFVALRIEKNPSQAKAQKPRKEVKMPQ